MSKIILPTNTNPLIKCYRIHAYVLNLIEPHYPTFINYILCNYLNLHNNAPTHPMNYLDFNLDNNFLNVRENFRYNDYFDIIQINLFDKNFLIHQNEIVPIIADLLNKGYYILHKANEVFYPHLYDIPEGSADNTVLTHGFDNDENTMFVLGYNRYGKFQSHTVKLQDYLYSLSTVVGSNRLNFIKVKNNLDFRFDYHRSLKLIDCYINSQNAYPDHEDFKMHIFGYNSIKRAIDELKNKYLNIINIRVILEHKNIISKYMDYIFKNKFFNYYPICEQYNSIVNNMNIIFLKTIKKMIVYSKHYDYTEEYDSIMRLNEQESVLLTNFINYQ